MADTTGKPSQDRPGPAGHDEAAGAPPLWEWGVGLLGLVLVVAAAGYLALHALAGDDAAPDPVVEVAAVHAQTGGYAVVVHVHNRSRATAANLNVAGTLSRGAQVVEESDTQLQFLPGESTREAGLFFAHDPRRHALVVRAKGYEKP